MSEISATDATKRFADMLDAVEHLGVIIGLEKPQPVTKRATNFGPVRAGMVKRVRADDPVAVDLKIGEHGEDRVRFWVPVVAISARGTDLAAVELR